MFRSILRGFDLWFALAVSLALRLLAPRCILNHVAKEIYEVGVSVLSIVFAVFFTALAIIIAAGDDDFIEYLSRLEVYDRIMNVFRFTLNLLFVALFSAVALFVFSVIDEAAGSPEQSIWWMTAFSFLFSYSLLATIGSTRDSFNYARFRVKFLGKKSLAQPTKPPADPPSPKA